MGEDPRKKEYPAHLKESVNRCKFCDSELNGYGDCLMFHCKSQEPPSRMQEKRDPEEARKVLKDLYEAVFFKEERAVNWLDLKVRCMRIID